MDDAVLAASKDMWHVLKSLLGLVRWPEAIAAIALVIQAFILLQHRRILTRYGEALERQGETAKLIGHALEQHGRILSDTARIMDEHFKFQRKIEANIEKSAAPTTHPDNESSRIALSK